MDNVIHLVPALGGRRQKPSQVVSAYSSLKQRFAETFAADKARTAAMARQGPALMQWVADSVDTVDKAFAIEQLRAALKALEAQP